MHISNKHIFENLKLRITQSSSLNQTFVYFPSIRYDFESIKIIEQGETKSALSGY